MKKLADRNIDSLVDKFALKVYGTVKGELRLKLLQEDLSMFHVKQQSGLAQSSLKIWDAGCGFGQISEWLAQAGHEMVL